MLHNLTLQLRHSAIYGEDAAFVVQEPKPQSLKLDLHFIENIT